MGEVIVITSGKGGVGKTTTTANIGAALAQMGKKVAMLDTDIGLRNLDIVMGLENRIVYDIVNVVEGVCRPKQALIKDKRFMNLYVMPAAQSKDKSALSPGGMIKLCNELKNYFDYIIIDCPAGIEQGFQNAVAAADSAIIVTTPEVSSIRDADRVIGLLEAREIHKHSLIINKMRSDMVRKGDMLTVNDIVEILAEELIGVIPDDESVIVSTNRGEPAVLSSGRSSAGLAYKNIARRITGEAIPILNEGSKKKKREGFLSKLFRAKFELTEEEYV